MALKGQRCSLGAAAGKHGAFGGVSAALLATVVIPPLPSASSLCRTLGLGGSFCINYGSRTSQQRGAEGEATLGGPADPGGVGSVA